MFTGIVQSTGQVNSIKIGDNFKHIEILVPIQLISKLETGASVANNGVCLTAVSFSKLDSKSAVIGFDIIDETLRVTNLDSLVTGSLVNVERSMKVGDEIGGHMVSGHIHTMATLVERLDSTDNCQLNFVINSNWTKYIFAKGFIAVNGASLTLGEVRTLKNGDCEFTLHLIPETLERTNLTVLKLGDKVNIEIDQQTMTIVDSLASILKEYGIEKKLNL
ncbi:riboflavin synthase subunit alpha [Thalassotalea psychrophila]|uniref:Riboflavin synthase n=1 Tax=Thalassotalea psychrophila TaxID=3065647 RepID=A0ABY9TZ36_9GAMM|nr:riboflavin synthase subunit alpha [Colwelliaceae bacterium SQ149]